MFISEVAADGEPTNLHLCKGQKMINSEPDSDMNVHYYMYMSLCM